MTQAVLLINTNITRPPVSPVGLEYIGETLIETGVPLQVLDLSFETDWKASLHRQLGNEDPLLIGLSVRNTDDCSFLSRKSFLPWIKEVVTEVKNLTAAPVFLGGAGFSIMPEAVLTATQADGGIAGDGEETLAALAKALMKGADTTHLPNMVYRHSGNIICNPRVNVDLRYLPKPHRRIFDNKKYEQLGAMVGIETKRGCPQKCIFCADPVTKGSEVRLRPPPTVARELQGLTEQGVSWFHLCDSEFNIPLEHAKDVCQAIIDSGLGNKIRWYTYCSPVPFDIEMASLMKSAGSAGINFGIDSLCDEQLRRLGRVHSESDISRLVHLLDREGLNYMCDLLIGGPGETPETLSATVSSAKMLNIPLVGISAGVRVYPNTPLARAINNGVIEGGRHFNVDEGSDTPVFYLSPGLGDNALDLIEELVDGDPRFLLLARPSEERSYNYADDEPLCQLIKNGARGAYWDIIRQNPYSPLS